MVCAIAAAMTTAAAVAAAMMAVVAVVTAVALRHWLFAAPATVTVVAAGVAIAA